jgi:hypothetical protein
MTKKVPQREAKRLEKMLQEAATFAEELERKYDDAALDSKIAENIYENLESITAYVLAYSDVDVPYEW